jgi:sensor histidine kinase YesM
MFKGMIWKYVSIGMLVVVLGCAVTVGVLKHRLGKANQLVDTLATWQGEVVQAVRVASGNNKVTGATTKAQIQAMGNSITVLINDVDRQNREVQRLAEQKRQAEERAEQERRARAAAIKRAQEVVGRLENDIAPAPPARMEEVMRRAQDLVYEEGL